jgi:hypothetical protein
VTAHPSAFLETGVLIRTVEHAETPPSERQSKRNVLAERMDIILSSECQVTFES